jgi:hypothetical protein
MGNSAPVRRMKTTSRWGSASAGILLATRSDSGAYSASTWWRVSTNVAVPMSRSAEIHSTASSATRIASLRHSASEMRWTRLPRLREPGLELGHLTTQVELVRRVVAEQRVRHVVVRAELLAGVGGQQDRLEHPRHPRGHLGDRFAHEAILAA